MSFRAAVNLLLDELQRVVVGDSQVQRRLPMAARSNASGSGGQASASISLADIPLPPGSSGSSVSTSNLLAAFTTAPIPPMFLSPVLTVPPPSPSPRPPIPFSASTAGVSTTTSQHNAATPTVFAAETSVDAAPQTFGGSKPISFAISRVQSVQKLRLPVFRTPQSEFSPRTSPLHQPAAVTAPELLLADLSPVSSAPSSPSPVRPPLIVDDADPVVEPQSPGMEDQDDGERWAVIGASDSSGSNAPPPSALGALQMYAESESDLSDSDSLNEPVSVEVKVLLNELIDSVLKSSLDSAIALTAFELAAHPPSDDYDGGESEPATAQSTLLSDSSLISPLNVDFDATDGTGGGTSLSTSSPSSLFLDPQFVPATQSGHEASPLVVSLTPQLIPSDVIAIETRPIMSIQIQSSGRSSPPSPPPGYSRCAVVLEKVPVSPTALQAYIQRELAKNVPITHSSHRSRARGRRVRFVAARAASTDGKAKRRRSVHDSPAGECVMESVAREWEDDGMEVGGVRAAIEAVIEIDGSASDGEDSAAAATSVQLQQSARVGDSDELRAAAKRHRSKGSRGARASTSVSKRVDQRLGREGRAIGDRRRRISSDDDESTDDKSFQRSPSPKRHRISSPPSRSPSPKRSRRPDHAEVRGRSSSARQDKHESSTKSARSSSAKRGRSKVAKRKRSTSPKPKRSCAGNVGRPLFDRMMAKPTLIFHEADGDTSRRAGPAARIPPTAIADQERSRMSKKKLVELVQEFIQGDSDTALLFSTLQHQERLEVMRILLPEAFSKNFNVEPLIRLLCQNCTAVNDPYAGIVSALRPELIDSSRSSHASSAHFMLFYYVLPLFVQRWGLMTVGTPSTAQWGALAQHYTNWSKAHRWPELFAVAPTETTAFIRIVLKDPACSLSGEFQRRLGILFAKHPKLVSRWWLVRRQAHAVRRDPSGRSLEANLIPAQNANWLEVLSPTNVRAGMTLAEELPLSTAVDFPVHQVYRDAIPIIADLLANANPETAHVRRVDRVLLAEQMGGAVSTWITSTSGDAAVDTAVGKLQQSTLSQVTVTLGTSASIPDLLVACPWRVSHNDEGVLNLRVPLLNWTGLFDELGRYKSATTPNAQEQPVMIDASTNTFAIDEGSKETSGGTEEAAISAINETQ